MKILVLDSIHGGAGIGRAYADAGHTADVVDVYRGTTPGLAAVLKDRTYDLVAAPVHLDPDNPFLKSRHEPVITHHEAVRRLLGRDRPSPMVEITGARGKTTTAHALAHILGGSGVLHTSTGTYSYPARELLWKRSITPASLLPAADHAGRMPGWLVAEESLGVTGAGDLVIITSAEDYTFANNRKHAISAKLASAAGARCVLVADGISCDAKNTLCIGDLARCEGDECTVRYEGTTSVVRNPLFRLPPYRTALMLAAAAARILHRDPAPLATFPALPGRLSLSHEKDLVVVDNSNSGTNYETTLCAVRYARSLAGVPGLTLVIGQAAKDGAVCEGFPFAQIEKTISMAAPDRVILVGNRPESGTVSGTVSAGSPPARIGRFCSTFEEGKAAALEMTDQGSIVLAVKSWR